VGTKRQRGERYPVEYVASELGVDRKMLVRRLETAAVVYNGEGITFREAFDAISAKSEIEADRARQKKAEAESAEIDAAQKKGRLMLKSEHEAVVSELAVRTRAAIQSAEYIPKEDRQRLTRELAEVKVKL
jgi:hypothetical protein